jgi:hypothetical protein
VVAVAALAANGPARAAPMTPPVSKDPATAAPVMAFCIAFILFTSSLCDGAYSGAVHLSNPLRGAGHFS